MKNTFGNSVTITLFGESHGPETGAVLDIVKFSRFERGEGIEKRKDDLAAEIAAMTK